MATDIAPQQVLELDALEARPSCERVTWPRYLADLYIKLIAELNDALERGATPRGQRHRDHVDLETLHKLWKSLDRALDPVAADVRPNPRSVGVHEGTNAIGAQRIVEIARQYPT